MTVTSQNYQLKTGNVQIVKVESLTDIQTWLESLLPETFTVTRNTDMGGSVSVFHTTDNTGYTVFVGEHLIVDEDGNISKIDLDTLKLFYKPTV